MKTFIKKYLLNKYLIISATIVLALLFPLPYYVVLPGGAKDVNTYLDVRGGTKSQGEFMLTYVLVPKGSLATLFFTLFEKESEIISQKDEEYGVDSQEEKEFRDKMYMTESIDNAYVNFLKYAKVPYTVIEKHGYITSFDRSLSSEHKNANIKVGDELLSIDGYSLTTMDEIRNYLKTKKEGDLVTLKLKRNKDTIETTIPLVKRGERLYIGIMVMYDRKIDSDVKISFDDRGLSGPSAGMMMSLTLLDQYLKEDLTKGYKIAGTGTIDDLGNVGPIGGIKLKVLSAEKSKAKYFLAPDVDNGSGKTDYEEAMEIKNERHLKIEIVPVKVFDDAVRFLETLPEK